MSEEYVLQITYQGIDEKGRTVMLNIRGTTEEQFDKLRKHVAADINALKPLPVKQYGGNGQAAKKQIVYLPDAPKCPKHQRPVTIREWTSPEGKVLHFWSCQEKGADGWCKEKIKPDPTPEQVAKWRDLNGIETPKAAEQPASEQKPTTEADEHAISWKVAFESLGLPEYKAKAFLNTAKNNYETAYKLASQKHA